MIKKSNHIFEKSNFGKSDVLKLQCGKVMFWKSLFAELTGRVEPSHVFGKKRKKSYFETI